MKIIKIALIGDGAVGKTALRRSFIGHAFKSSYYVTIGADFAVYETKIGIYDVKFQIWDLAGQPRFSAVRSTYYQGVLGCLMVYDILRRETLDNTPKWVLEAFKNSGHGAVPLILVGNKIDLRGKNPIALQPRDGRMMAEKINSIISKKGFNCVHTETSAKTGENVDNSFKELGRSILELKEW
ncbi:MAG: GTP-binding protein [Candidatus Hodarchaeales archaeon]|jgi:small GTP-binding protein